MDELAHVGWIDRVVAALAERQHGVVARWQLRALGIGRGAIDARILRKRLHPVHRGTYALTPAPLERLGRWMAAVLAGGEGAVLSHWSAASLWRLRAGSGPRSHVTAARQRRSNGDVTFHRARLRADEVAVRDGIPVTTPARTILDLAPSLRVPVLARMLEAADGLASHGPSVRELLDRHRGRAGTTALAAALGAPRTMTRSDFEATVIDRIAAAGLPRPIVNCVVEGYEVDLAWPEHGVIAELDTFATHGSRAAFERDRERDRKLAAAGWQVVRITDGQVEDALADLRRLLGASAARSPSRRAAAW